MKNKMNFEEVKKNLLEHLRDDNFCIDLSDKTAAKNFGVSLSALNQILNEIIKKSLTIGSETDELNWDQAVIYSYEGSLFVFSGGGMSAEYIEACSIVKKNKLLLHWYSGQEHVETQYKLGLMHQRGNGVIQDRVISYVWFKIAASNGDTRASEQLDIMAKEMTAAQIKEAQKLARECVAKNYKEC
jgi:hypothetical protein